MTNGILGVTGFCIVLIIAGASSLSIPDAVISGFHIGWIFIIVGVLDLLVIIKDQFPR